MSARFSWRHHISMSIIITAPLGQFIVYVKSLSWCNNSICTAHVMYIVNDCSAGSSTNISTSCCASNTTTGVVSCTNRSTGTRVTLTRFNNQKFAKYVLDECWARFGLRNRIWYYSIVGLVWIALAPRFWFSANMTFLSLNSTFTSLVYSYYQYVPLLLFSRGRSVPHWFLNVATVYSSSCCVASVFLNSPPNSGSS
jgi:hypothetical protein